MTDDVSVWSEELARDPDSLVFLPLGESLRRQKQLSLAHKIALRGLQRHSQNADAHDLLARISVDLGEVQRALDEWGIALRLQPSHVGALKGMGFVCFQQGRLKEAEHYLAQAALEAPDAGVKAALEYVRQKGHAQPSAALSPTAAASTSSELFARPAESPADPRYLFRPLLGETEAAVLLLDSAGLVLAGEFLAPDGRDVSSEVGAQLSGLPDEAQRATRHLDIGEWRSIVFETEHAVAGIMPVTPDALVVLTASRATPLGLLRRLLAQCAVHGRDWMVGKGLAGDSGSGSPEESLR